MVTVVTVHNEFMFDDETAELVEDLLTDVWAEMGVDYKWINPNAIQITLPDNVSYADVLEDMGAIIMEYYDAKTYIPVELICHFSIGPNEIKVRLPRP